MTLGSKKVEKKVSKQTQTITYILYILLVAFIIAYALHNNIFLGLGAFFVIVALVITEMRTSVQTEGAKKSAVDVIIAVAAAVVLWLVLTVLLQTSAPIDAVASCSMLPVLHRGDLVVLHGIVSAPQFLGMANVPVVNVSPSAFAGMEQNINGEFVAFYAYQQNNRSKISQIVTSPNVSVGLYNTACLTEYSDDGLVNDYYKCAVASQGNNLIKYNYTIGRVQLSGVNEYIVETSTITIGNTTLAENYSNPIIVYRTTSSDYFSGDIIHRVYAAIRTGSSYYFLTKGDNNPALDIQFANYPPPLNQTVGTVILDAPVLGYVKLILDGQLGTVAGCNQQILR